MLDLLGHGVEFDAVFHGDHCRLTLSRRWGPGPIAYVIGCNPSDAHKRNGTKPLRFPVASSRRLANE